MRLLAGMWFVCGLLFSQPSDWLNQGIADFKAGKYAEAVEHFQRAVDREPENVQAHLYLATAYMAQHSPSSPAAENLEFARRAEAEFRTVLSLSPNHIFALESLASLALQHHKELDEAQGWYERLIAADEKHALAHYGLGVIAWSRFYQVLMEARARLGMGPQDPGPLRDAATGLDLTNRFGRVVEDGIRHMEKAMELVPEYSDAMAYMNLLLRERADLRATLAEYQADVGLADEWVAKALNARHAKEAVPDAPPNSFRPPPRIMAGGSVPRIVRLGRDAAKANLVSQPPPKYPPEAVAARIQGTVRFEALIGSDGKVAELRLLGGHPWLAAAAEESVRQSIYKPTLLNGEPVVV